MKNTKSLEQRSRNTKKTKTNLAQRRSGAEKNKSKKLCVSAPLREDKSI